MPVNVLSALCNSGNSYPEVLGTSGYYVSGLEVPIRADDGTVVIDVVMFQPERNIILAGEAKSGTNVEGRQAGLYGRLRADAVIQAASINVPARGDLRIQPLYCCPADNVDRILQGLDSAGVDCPVLAFDDESIAHRGSPFIDPTLGDAFADPVPVRGPPPRKVPVDNESPDHLFDDLVVVASVAELSRGRTEVSLPALAEQALPHLPIYAKAARHQLVQKVDAAARRVAGRNGATFEYLARTATRDPAVVRFLRSPEDAAPQGRTQSYQAIRRSHRGDPQDRFESRSTQMSFFDEMMGEFLQGDGTMVEREDEQ